MVADLKKETRGSSSLVTDDAQRPGTDVVEQSGCGPSERGLVSDSLYETIEESFTRIYRIIDAFHILNALNEYSDDSGRVLEEMQDVVKMYSGDCPQLGQDVGQLGAGEGGQSAAGVVSADEGDDRLQSDHDVVAGRAHLLFYITTGLFSLE
jgi:hypothetical protein